MFLTASKHLSLGELIALKNNTITRLFSHGYYFDFINLAFKLIGYMPQTTRLCFMMRFIGYTHFWEDIKHLMEKGRKSSQPPYEDILMCGRTKLNDQWYGRPTVPTGRTECRRHRLIKWSNFCEGIRDVFAPETP